jgi:hypothetical protein
MLKRIVKMNFNFNYLRIAFLPAAGQRASSQMRVICITQPNSSSEPSKPPSETRADQG